MNGTYQKALESILDDLDQVMADLEDVLEDAQEENSLQAHRDIHRMEEALRALNRAADVLAGNE